MHTLAKNQHHNDRLIEFFMDKAYSDMGLEVTIKELIKDNIINGTQLAELAISRRSGIGMCPIGEHRDLLDDTDVKTVTVQAKYFHPTVKGKLNKKIKIPRYQAVVNNAHKKIGTLRVVCYNPVSDKYYYFLIPPSAYYSVQNITISFEKDTQELVGRFKQFEVPEFNDVCRHLTIKEQVDQLVCNVSKETIVQTIDAIMELFETYKKS